MTYSRILSAVALTVLLSLLASPSSAAAVTCEEFFQTKSAYEDYRSEFFAPCGLPLARAVDLDLCCDKSDEFSGWLTECSAEISSAGLNNATQADLAQMVAVCQSSSGSSDASSSSDGCDLSTGMGCGCDVLFGNLDNLDQFRQRFINDCGLSGRREDPFSSESCCNAAEDWAGWMQECEFQLQNNGDIETIAGQTKETLDQSCEGDSSSSNNDGSESSHNDGSESSHNEDDGSNHGVPSGCERFASVTVFSQWAAELTSNCQQDHFCCDGADEFFAAYSRCAAFVNAHSDLLTIKHNLIQVFEEHCHKEEDGSGELTCPIQINSANLTAIYEAAVLACSSGEKRTGQCSDECMNRIHFFVKMATSCFGSSNELSEEVRIMKAQLLASCDIDNADHQCEINFKEQLRHAQEVCQASKCSPNCRAALETAAAIAEDCDHTSDLKEHLERVINRCEQCVLGLREQFEETRGQCSECGSECQSEIMQFNSLAVECESANGDQVAQIDADIIGALCEFADDAECLLNLHDEAVDTAEICLSQLCTSHCSEAIQTFAEAHSNCVPGTESILTNVLNEFRAICDIGNDEIIQLVIRSTLSQFFENIDEWRDLLAALADIASDRIQFILAESKPGRQSQVQLEVQLLDGEGTSAKNAAASLLGQSLSDVGIDSASSLSSGDAASSASMLTASAVFVVALVVSIAAVLL